MEPYGSTVFCDDIREELHGKLSIIGVYRSGMIFWSPLPALLPKLGIFVTGVFPIGYNVSNPRILVFLPGEFETPSYAFQLNWKGSGEGLLPDKNMFPDALGVFWFNQHLIMGSVQIKQAGYIRVRMICDDKIIRIGSLYVQERPVPSTSSPQT
jgi:hypothetical protein